LESEEKPEDKVLRVVEEYVEEEEARLATRLEVLREVRDIIRKKLKPIELPQKSE